jgi:geranylgeranyl diphosphate synthase, type I
MVVSSQSPLDTDDLRDRVNEALDEFIAAQQGVLDQVSQDLDSVMNGIRTILNGGKRIRPAFAYWGWRAAGRADGDAIVTAAASLELLQASALMHDDVMDGSDTRRGQPSVHRRFAALHEQARWNGSPTDFGTGAAILLGDLAFAWADEMLFESGLSGDELLRAKPCYDRMRTELMSGQYLDLLSQARGDTTVEQALHVARFKSAKYTVEGPLQLGAQLAGDNPRLMRVLSDYGLPLGEAFQLRDDLLGVFGDPQQTGKPTGDDLREGKRTALVALTLEAASQTQRATFVEGLGNRELDSDGIGVLQHIIIDSGARDVVEKLIQDRTEQACRALTDVPEPALDVLTELAHATTSRQG